MRTSSIEPTSAPDDMSGSTVNAVPTFRSILPTIAASALEGYDLTIYGLFAGTIARQFFPSGDANFALLLTVATLGIGYVVRPLGGIVLGSYGDRMGRKAAIFITVALMALSTGVMGLIPAYSSIGNAAPILIVIARIVQGFAAGAGASSSISFLAEVAPPKRRGFFASWHQTVQVGAFLFASALGAVISNVVPAEHTSSIGWRIPFLLALAFGPIAWLIKSKLQEPARIAPSSATKEIADVVAPVARGLGREVGNIAIGFGVSCLWTITLFLLLIFMPTYANKSFGIPLSGAYTSATIGGIVLFVLCPLFGRLSDWAGRRATMLSAAVLFAVLIYPIFAYVGSMRTAGALIAAQIVLSVLIAAYTGPIGAFLAELFSSGVRSTALSIANNIAVTIIGSFAPLITTFLIRITHNPLAPAYYIMGGAIVSAIALLFARDKTGQPLVR